MLRIVISARMHRCQRSRKLNQLLMRGSTDPLRIALSMDVIVDGRHRFFIVVSR